MINKFHFHFSRLHISQHSAAVATAAVEKAHKIHITQASNGNGNSQTLLFLFIFPEKQHLLCVFPAKLLYNYIVLFAIIITYYPFRSLSLSDSLSRSLTRLWPTLCSTIHTLPFGNNIFYCCLVIYCFLLANVLIACIHSTYIHIKHSQAKHHRQPASKSEKIYWCSERVLFVETI
jgi:hypothetical protein